VVQVKRLRVWAVVPGAVVAAAAALAAAAGPAMGSPAMASTAMASTAVGGPVATTTAPRPVVLVGIPGLRWSDVSKTATPELWRLASAGSVGSLVVHTISNVTCPGDGWLTLNSGTRATVRHVPPGECPALPAVTTDQPVVGGTPVAAHIAQMPALERYNTQFHYGPDWGLLGSAAGRGQCSTAIGPGAALALASPQGEVSGYLPSVAAATKATFARCPLTAVDLGALSASSGRAAQVKADDSELGRISAELPARAILVIAAAGDDLAYLAGKTPYGTYLAGKTPYGTSHLRLIVVDGGGYADGLLHTASTRQPGLTQLTDITASVLRWRGQDIPSQALGSPLNSGSRPGLAAEIKALLGQDTAAQVYRATFGWFFAIFAVGEAIIFGLIAVLLRGRAEDRRRRRRAVCRVFGVVAGCVPAGTFLASLVSWWMLPHPALVLYALAAAWTAVIAVIALAGPWRRDPFGPPGVIGAITLAVVGIDVMTGSRLELSTPFGLNVLWGGRFYGEDNNTVGIYAAAAVLCAVWLAALLLRRHREPGPTPSASAAQAAPDAQSDLPTPADSPARSGLAARFRLPGWHGPRGRAAAVVSLIALFAIVASGWPGFGAKVGGTIATVPGFVVLIMAVAGVRITWRRAVVIAVSGVVVIAAFALVNYFVPTITGHSDIGAFAGQAIHGQGGGTLQRKISTNLDSLTTTPYSVLIPFVVVALGVLLLRPAWFGAGSLAEARRSVPLLSVTLATIWVMAVLGWFAEDSGVAVPASMLPFVLPLAIAIVSSAPRPAGGPLPDGADGRTMTATSPAGNQAAG
jgi:hypothetical protein